MPKKKFYYVKFPILDERGNKIDEVARPIIEIILNYKHGRMIGPIGVLIDSGADFNLFPSVIGVAMGINIKKGKKLSTFGISGESLTTYRHSSIRVFVEGNNFETFIEFGEEYKGIPILGQQGFFDKFKKITLSRVKEEIVLEF